jgi:hypothetical protein
MRFSGFGRGGLESLPGYHIDKTQLLGIITGGGFVGQQCPALPFSFLVRGFFALTFRAKVLDVENAVRGPFLKHFVVILGLRQHSG